MIALPSLVFAAHHENVLLTSFFRSAFTYLHIVLHILFMYTCIFLSATQIQGISAAAQIW